nr:hypothetical protein [Rhodococcus wratislaviensis]
MLNLAVHGLWWRCRRTGRRITVPRPRRHMSRPVRVAGTSSGARAWFGVRDPDEDDEGVAGTADNAGDGAGESGGRGDEG